MAWNCWLTHQAPSHIFSLCLRLYSNRPSQDLLEQCTAPHSEQSARDTRKRIIMNNKQTIHWSNAGHKLLIFKEFVAQLFLDLWLSTLCVLFRVGFLAPSNVYGFVDCVYESKDSNKYFEHVRRVDPAGRTPSHLNPSSRVHREEPALVHADVCLKNHSTRQESCLFVFNWTKREPQRLNKDINNVCVWIMQRLQMCIVSQPTGKYVNDKKLRFRRQSCCWSLWRSFSDCKINPNHRFLFYLC